MSNKIKAAKHKEFKASLSSSTLIDAKMTEAMKAARITGIEPPVNSA
jgi:hypothetical protein